MRDVRIGWQWVPTVRLGRAGQPRMMSRLTLGLLGAFTLWGSLPVDGEALRIRKDQRDLSAEERASYIAAVWEMKNTPIPNAGMNDPQNVYDALTDLHRLSMVDAHENASFLPWHREFLWEFETELLAADSRLHSCTANSLQANCTPSDPILTGLPYWDWTADQGTTTGPWTADFMGGDGDAGTHIVNSGPFAAATGWTVWDPENFNGGPELKRAFGAKQSANGLFPDLPQASDLSAAMQVPNYDVAPFGPSSDGTLSFRNRLEGWNPVVPSLHNLVHVWVDGTMFEAKISPGDPIFYLHHSFVDRAWWEWQQLHGIGPENYQPVLGGNLGQNLNDMMANMDVTPADMLDINGPQLGYIYAPHIPESAKPRDIVIALDVSSSMYDDAGFGGLTKLDAAKGAVNLLTSLMDPNAGHRIGLVEFDETAMIRQPLTESTSLNVTPGNIPFDHLRRRGATDLTDALATAQSLFPPKTEDTNAPTILLLTDGNHTAASPFASPSFGTTQLNVIGFGNENDVDGALLADLSTDSGGIFYRAQNVLGTKKALVATYGETFTSGVGIDPYYVFSSGSGSVEPLTFGVNDEQVVTVVVAWEHAGAIANVELVGPQGWHYVADPNQKPSDSGVQVVWSDTFATIKVPVHALPQGGHGAWQVVTHRTGTPSENGSLEYPATDEPFFITTVVDGGAKLRSTAPSLVYTGDKVIPTATLLDRQGHPVAAQVELFLGPSGMEGHGASHHLMDMGAPADGGVGDGIYGALLDHITQPGSHDFMVRASYGDPAAPSIRETMWSTFVEVGINAAATPFHLRHQQTLPDGWNRSTFSITPQDALGHLLGPHKQNGMSLDTPDNRMTTAKFGKITETDVPGTYEFSIDWNPTEGLPDLLLVQPQRHGERFVTPGSMRGESGDQVVDVMISPLDGTLNVALDSVNAMEITIESAQGIFAANPMLHSLPGVQIDVTPTMIHIRLDSVTTSDPHAGMGGMAMDMGPDMPGMDPSEPAHNLIMQLGMGFLDPMANDIDLMSDLTIQVARGEKVTHFVTLTPATVAGDLMLIPEPSFFASSSLLLFLLLHGQRRHAW